MGIIPSSAKPCGDIPVKNKNSAETLSLFVNYGIFEIKILPASTVQAVFIFITNVS